MYGYHLDIQHIRGKVNLVDNLPQQSLIQDIEQKDVFRVKNDEFVERMRIPENSSD